MWRPTYLLVVSEIATRAYLALVLFGHAAWAPNSLPGPGGVVKGLPEFEIGNTVIMVGGFALLQAVGGVHGKIRTTHLHVRRYVLIGGTHCLVCYYIGCHGGDR